MKIMFIIIISICFAVLAGTLFTIRTATHDPKIWHVDPMTFVDPTTPNFYRIGPSDQMVMPVNEESPIYAGSPELLSEAFDTFVMGQPRVNRINIDEKKAIAEAWVTYVQTTVSIGFPDYISVRFIDQGDGSSVISLISRSRYGYSDQGVNAARIKLWMPGIESFIAESSFFEPEPEESEIIPVDDAAQEPTERELMENLEQSEQEAVEQQEPEPELDTSNPEPSSEEENPEPVSETAEGDVATDQ